MADQPKTKDEGTEEKDVSFEAAMEQLEDIVRKLEENNVPLEEAISLFQKGIGLSKTCHQKLQKVENQMDQILNEDGTFKAFKLQEDESK